MLSRMKALIIGRSIRGRVVRFLLVVGLTPLLAIAPYIAFSQRDVLSQTANDNLANHARLEATTVQHILDDAAGNIDVLASNPVLRSPTASREEKSEQLRQAQDFFDIFEDITLIDPQGNVIDSTSYSYTGAWSEKGWFQQALAGQPAISEAHLILSPKRLVVVFTAPIISDGQVTAVVAGQLNMEHVWGILDTVRIGETGFLVAIDRNGNIISHPNKELLLSKLDGQVDPAGSEDTSIRVPATEGGDSLVGQVAPVNILDWQVVALQSSAEANTLVEDALEKIAVTGAAVVVLVVGVSLTLSREIARPIRAMAAAMQRIAAGSLSQRVSSAELREINDLSTSFNTMAANLETSTQRLKSANEELEKRYEELMDARREAATDSLTGLYNHRALHEALAKEVESSLRNGHPVAVLMMDVSGFRLFNSTYGHQAGDRVLRQVARVFMTTCRAGDLIGRYEGDAFMAILPDTDREQATDVANQIIEAISSERVRVANGEDVPLNISIGLAICPDDSESKEELLAYADDSLHEAKQSSGSTLVVTHQKPGDMLSRKRTPFGVLDALVRAVDKKDRYTHQHSQQNAEFAVELGRAMGLSEGALSALRVAGLLHDVGKIGVPDDILMKPGPLTEEEHAIVREHVVLSNLIVHGVPNLQDVSDAVYSHHEHWDGTGYPRGLKGEEIPLSGRIMAIVDAYSAMILDRPYRKALTYKQALAELRRNAGTQFDPGLVDPFIRLLESWQKMAA